MKIFWGAIAFLIMVPIWFFGIGLMNTSKASINTTTNVSEYTGMTAVNDASPLLMFMMVLAIVFVVLFIAIFRRVRK